jgi:CRP/FNR family transcriptional regulator, anaerobic regulatory protein
VIALENTKPAAGIYDVMAFRNLSAAIRSPLDRGLRYIHYAKGASVLTKGQRVSGAFVVIAGNLRVFTLSPEGHEATLYLINAHETCVLALNCIFNDLLYPAWVEAGVATRVAMIPGTVFKTLFDSEPAIRNMTVHAFSTIVFRLMSELEEIHSCRLEQRLCNFLLLHASADGTLQLTQQEIASHLGTTREVVARALGQLSAEGRIRTSRRRIVINDPVRLAASVTRRGRRVRNSASRVVGSDG